MRAVVQRVASAHVDVDGARVGAVCPGRPGVLVLLGVGRDDTERDVAYVAQKVAGLRMFEDPEGKMNLSVSDVGGSVLVVSQFTLFGDCRKGRRPSFVGAMEPESARRLVEAFVSTLVDDGLHVETGRFQTHMSVTLVNDGPVTLLIDSCKTF